MCLVVFNSCVNAQQAAEVGYSNVQTVSEALVMNQDELGLSGWSSFSDCQSSAHVFLYSSIKVVDSTQTRTQRRAAPPLTRGQHTTGEVEHVHAITVIGALRPQNPGGCSF